jgi:hypothetical protein
MDVPVSNASVIKIIVKTITFILLLPITLIILLLHATLGSIIYMWLVFRFLIVYTFSVIRSAYLKRDVSNSYLVLIESLIYNYLRLYLHIARIPLAVWKSPENLKFEIEAILTREKMLLNDKLWLNVLILFLIILSLVFWFFGIFDLAYDLI